MFPSSKLNSSLRGKLGIPELFDLYRLVDTATHEVLEYSDGMEAPAATGELCHHIWKTDGPCGNCTSRACVNRRETIVKVMHLGERVLLIYSVPVEVAHVFYALELAKDVTSSFVVPTADRQDNLELTQMIERFNEIAVRDSFTGLYNKPYTLNLLQEAIDATDFGAPLEQRAVVVMLDLDRFKAVNDSYGHMVGDEVLLHFAHAFNELTKDVPGCWAARFGGDEFVLCAPAGVKSATHDALAHKLEEVQEKSFQAGGKSFSLTLSYGIAAAEPGDTAASLIARADDAMYAMKEQHHQC